MKKRIFAILITIVLLVPTTVYGKDANKNGKDNDNMTTKTEDSKGKDNSSKENAKEKYNTNSKQENKSTISENKALQQQFKTDIKLKHTIMKENIDKSIKIKKEISSKKQEIAIILGAIKAGTKTLSAEELNQLITNSSEIKQSITAIQSLPEINSDVKSVGNDIKSGKFETALASLDKVIAKQEDRYSKLVLLNENLNKLLAIAHNAKDVIIGEPSDNTKINDQIIEITE